MAASRVDTESFNEQDIAEIKRLGGHLLDGASSEIIRMHLNARNAEATRKNFEKVAGGLYEQANQDFAPYLEVIGKRIELVDKHVDQGDELIRKLQLAVDRLFSLWETSGDIKQTDTAYNAILDNELAQVTKYFKERKEQKLDELPSRDYKKDHLTMVTLAVNMLIQWAALVIREKAIDPEVEKNFHEILINGLIRKANCIDSTIRAHETLSRRLEAQAENLKVYKTKLRALYNKLCERADVLKKEKEKTTPPLIATSAPQSLFSAPAGKQATVTDLSEKKQTAGASR